MIFWREPDAVIPHDTGDWLMGRWDSRKVLRHCHNTWEKPQPAWDDVDLSGFDTGIENQDFSQTFMKNIQNLGLSRAGTPKFQNKHISLAAQ